MSYLVNVSRPEMSGRSLNDHLSHLLVQANRHLSRQLSAQGVSLDQWRLMKLLADRGGLSMTQVADELTLNLPTLTRIVDKMVQDALIYRIPDEKDRRKIRVQLSTKGELVLQSQNHRVQEHESKVELSYGDEHVRQLKVMLESLIRQIN